MKKINKRTSGGIVFTLSGSQKEEKERKGHKTY